MREKIKASQLINRLTNHALGKLKKSPMDASQVTAALGLLKKCVADLSSVELTGADGGPVQVLSAEMTPEEAARVYRDVMSGRA